MYVCQVRGQVISTQNSALWLDAGGDYIFPLPPPPHTGVCRDFTTITTSQHWMETHANCQSCVSVWGPLTFKLVCLFVADQSDAADVKFLEDDVDVALHGVEGQVSNEGGEGRLWRQLLLLLDASRAAAAWAGTVGTTHTLLNARM